MPLFTKSDQGLTKVKKNLFKLEKEIQEVTEKNLEKVVGLTFITSEFQLQNLRIDTFAYNPETNSFNIIEYKRSQNKSVIDQGYAYLSLMLNNKAEFILKYNEKKNKNLRKNDIDWSQSRIIFISQQFSTHQKAINFSDLPFEFWEVSRYKNSLIQYKQVKVDKKAVSIKSISHKDRETSFVDKQVKVYTEEKHLESRKKKIQELYEELKTQILSIDETIEVKPLAKYIAFKAETNFVDIHIQKTQIKMWLNLEKGELKDAESITRDVSDTGHWGNGDYEIVLRNTENLPVILSLIKQSYEKNS